MLFRLIVPVILVIGQCAISTPSWWWVSESQHRPATVNPPAEVGQTSLAPISKEQPAISSLEPVDSAKEAGSASLDRKPEEHRIIIPGESTTPSKIQPSQQNAVAQFQSTSETEHRIQISDRQSRTTDQYIECSPFLVACARLIHTVSGTGHMRQHILSLPILVLPFFSRQIGFQCHQNSEAANSGMVI
ncbi:hypothetical protein PSTT_00526 [Puccinia striiformis]|uniref:Uncharacterized protein n=1 Tax=Puccinia striiformis TaxID=27350 RepID=A0A2S4W662_9BASI|nr:hypothetical protein PSTT_00526 [Puccinia striiformis]